MYSGPGLLRLRLGVGPESQSIQVPLPVGAWARREAGQSVPVTAAPAGRPARLVCPSLGLRARASVSAALTRAAPLAGGAGSLADSEWGRSWAILASTRGAAPDWPAATVRPKDSRPAAHWLGNSTRRVASMMSQK